MPIFSSIRADVLITQLVHRLRFIRTGTLSFNVRSQVDAFVRIRKGTVLSVELHMKRGTHVRHTKELVNKGLEHQAVVCGAAGHSDCQRRLVHVERGLGTKAIECVCRIHHILPLSRLQVSLGSIAGEVTTTQSIDPCRRAAATLRQEAITGGLVEARNRDI
jgi:hypothetical protein